MGLLDDAIREHLELKRRHGADATELKQLEDEAFGQHDERPPATGSLTPAPPKPEPESPIGSSPSTDFSDIFDPPAKGEVPKADDLPELAEPEVPEFVKPAAPGAADAVAPDAEVPAPEAAEPVPVQPETEPEPEASAEDAPSYVEQPTRAFTTEETKAVTAPDTDPSLSQFAPPEPEVDEPSPVQEVSEPEPEVTEAAQEDVAPVSGDPLFDTAERIAISSEETQVHEVVADEPAADVPAVSEDDADEEVAPAPASFGYTPFEPPTAEDPVEDDEDVDDDDFPDADEEAAFEFESSTDEGPVFGGLFDPLSEEQEAIEDEEPAAPAASRPFEPPTMDPADSDFPDTAEEDELASAALMETAEHLFPSTQAYDVAGDEDELEEDEDVVEYDSDEYEVVEDDRGGVFDAAADDPASGAPAEDDELDTPDFLKSDDDDDLWFEQGKPRDFDF